MRSNPKRPNRFYKYMTAEVGKIVLDSKKLRWSSPILFNDPFDVKREFSLGFESNEIREPLINELKRLVYAKDIPDLSSKPKVAFMINRLRSKDYDDIRETVMSEIFQSIDDNPNSDGSLEIMKRQWASFLPELRILCLSESNDNIALWSHYSDSHKGVVLELKSVEELDSVWLIAQPIVYLESSPILATKSDWIKSITGEKPLNYHEWQFYEPYVLTKTKDWEKEKEWRVVDFLRPPEAGLYSDRLFNPIEAVSVYLGCEISDKDAGDGLTLLHDDLSHVKAYHGRKNESQRVIEFEQIK